MAGFAKKSYQGFARNVIGGGKKRFFRFLRNVQKSDVYCKASLIAA
jgi:hypothetical protein